MGSEREALAAEIVGALQGVLAQVAEPVVVLESILRHAVHATGADRGLLAEVRDDGALVFSVLTGFQDARFSGNVDAFSRNLFERVIRTGEPILLANAIDDEFFGGIESVRALRASAILCSPIRVKDRTAAIVHLEHRESGHFRPEHAAIVRSLLEIAAPVLGALRAGRDVLEERDRLRNAESALRDEAREGRALLANEWSFGRYVGRSRAVRELETAVANAATTDFPVLLLGEPGTGKTLLARVMHSSGARATRPLVTVFCPSLERGMVEAELFGHCKGAFTGAVSDRIGRVQAADGGTLFLDEIGELPPEIQPKLLRFLQDRTFERVGDPKERSADVRIIAATNRDLALEVQQGRFRRDLYDRLNFLPIRVPPLRERTEDLPALLRHCLDRTPQGRWIEPSPEALSWLGALDFTWPGNVRHVEQLAARLSAEGRKGVVSAADLARLLGAREAEASPATTAAAGEPDFAAGLPAMLDDAERQWLELAMRRYGGLTRAELAARLKISESALYKRLRRYQLGD
jgi:Nif-specific regulatory protein